MDVYRKKEPHRFDEAVENNLEGAIVNSVTDAVFNREKEAVDWILKVPRALRELSTP